MRSREQPVPSRGIFLRHQGAPGHQDIDCCIGVLMPCRRVSRKTPVDTLTPASLLTSGIRSEAATYKVTPALKGRALLT
jgi:hypothetical protein